MYFYISLFPQYFIKNPDKMLTNEIFQFTCPDNNIF